MNDQTDATEIRPPLSNVTDTAIAEVPPPPEPRWVTGSWPPDARNRDSFTTETGVASYVPTAVQVPTPRPPAAANRAIVQPSPLTAVGNHLRYLPPHEPVHPVDVRRPRHAVVEETAQPSWWRRERTHLLAGMAGGGLVLFVAALVYVTWAVLT